MRRARSGATRPSASQKGAQHQDTSGRGCSWYAAASPCHFGFRRGLHTCSGPRVRLQRGICDRRQGIRLGRAGGDCREPGDESLHTVALQPQEPATDRHPSLQGQASCGERFPAPEGMARHRDPLCQTPSIFPFGCLPALRYHMD